MPKKPISEPDASFWFEMATSHMSGLEIIATRNEGYLYIPIYFLAGFVVELSLKSFLVSKGYKQSQLKKFSHNLDRLLQESVGNGLVIAGTDTKSTISELGQYHQEFLFRYPKDAHLLITENDKLIAALRDLLDSVARHAPITLPLWRP